MSRRCATIKQRIEETIKFLEPHLPLVGNAMVHYFSKSLYGVCLDERLRKEIALVGEKRAINMILDNKVESNMPELHRFLEQAKHFSLSSDCLSVRDFEEKLSQLGGESASTVKLEKFMNPKKSHEVSALAALIASLSSACEISHLIDIGDGKGYLSSLLALHHDIPVLGVDSSQVKTNSAGKRLEKLQRAWKGLGLPLEGSVDGALYKRRTLFVDENVKFKKVVADAFSPKAQATSLGLIGLHTCGDLGPTSVRLFDSDESIKVLCNVACCYHLLDENENAGFPMSGHLKSRGFALGRDARMLAAQSIERIRSQNKLTRASLLHRAILQELLERLGVDATKTAGKFKRDCGGFVEYARKALPRMGLDLGLSDAELEGVFGEHAGEVDAMNVYYLLRCSLAPVIESLILLDRLLFLHERGHEDAYLVRLFDPVISPRCYGLVAVK